MTQKIKFLSYDETPSVEGQKGIATILFMDEIILRYKLVNKKDGSGYFIASATLKAEPDGDKSNWVDAFTLERNSSKEEILSLIRAEVNGRSTGWNKPMVSKKDDGCPF